MTPDTSPSEVSDAWTRALPPRIAEAATGEDVPHWFLPLWTHDQQFRNFERQARDLSEQFDHISALHTTILADVEALTKLSGHKAELRKRTKT